jgi:molybdate-binding protein
MHGLEGYVEKKRALQAALILPVPMLRNDLDCGVSNEIRAEGSNCSFIDLRKISYHFIIKHYILLSIQSY